MEEKESIKLHFFIRNQKLQNQYLLSIVRSQMIEEHSMNLHINLSKYTTTMVSLR